ncbi:cell division-like protein [Kribbella sandramycini]|uniref:Cell division-like protein n=1 Tax=Kribbella sandramycini TaxID=60450 RepID=A0A7Y4L5D2_9ACTN|nr:FtsK/SpoIIIE domain-containing protein [Kribbella sandramycini]MBB6566932.1 S-DNA-T family DNA segregation ATPase FtsK/SpoIIIE [Kribbella sandramycini]NOL44654.1 cell division-like protein [Kribbella sandramycini]
MRFVLTVADPAAGKSVDVLVDAEAGLTVGALVPRLVAAVGRGTARPGNVVNLHESAPVGEVVPPVFVDGKPVDPRLALAASPLREGTLLSIGDSRGCLPTEPLGVVEVRVVSGPGAGSVHRLGMGTYTMGSSADAGVRLIGSGVPPLVATLNVAVTGEVTIRPEEFGGATGMERPINPLAGPIVIPDETGAEETTYVLEPGQQPALVELDRRDLSAGSRWTGSDWPPGAQLTIGPVMLTLAAVEPPDASLSPNPAGGTLDFNRPPRLLPPPRMTEFALPTEPEKAQKPTFPLLVMMLPLVGSVTLALILKQPGMLLFGLLSPLMYVGQYLQSRKEGKTGYRVQLAKYQEHKARVERDARRALVAERNARRRDLPDPAAVLLLATGPRARLWERRPTDPDWLELRVGIADLPSEVMVEDQSLDSHLRKRTWTAPDVPATLPLVGVGVLGVSGSGGSAQQIGAWLAGQLAALHSPRTLRLTVLCPPESAANWQWMRWLPHVRGTEDDGFLGTIGNDDETTVRRINELARLVEARRKALNSHSPIPQPALFAEQIVVIMDGARRLRLIPGVVGLLNDGPSVGVRFICLDSDGRQLPDEANAVIEPHGQWWRLRRTGTPIIDGIRPDLVTPQWLDRLARSLAPIQDVSGGDDATSVPASSRLLTVLGMETPAPDQLANGWALSGGRTTYAMIGEDAEGPFGVDIVRDGPHGLVAGTTGAGKSELLQSIIASLAVGNRPDEMTFVLVDYKGGAAFKDCSYLPHTVGMVTDLDGHLTTRALASLAAELHRRERQLDRAGAKDIEAYLERMGATDERMPRLLIVIDEFAAMVSELPDFVTGIVDIARRGRSLGVHLILATQRPAGVVSDDIKANTNLRIALRVTDAGDSSDVLEAPDAAYISKSTPGRGYARLGHSSLIPFQTSRVGGRPPGLVAATVGVRPIEWRDLGRPAIFEVQEAEDDVMVPTDLATLVKALRGAAELAGIETPPSPWLPPLGDIITLADLEVAAADKDGVLPPIPFGLTDVPNRQAREVATYDLESAGQLAIIGAPRSGRSATLRAIAGSIGRLIEPRDLHLYGVDCGNNALLPLISLPHTGAVVSREQVDRLTRLTGRLQAVIGNRQQQLATKGFADVAEQRRAAPADERLPYLVVLLDRWEGFVAAFESVDGGRLVDAWMQILQEGAGVGVKVVMTADRTALVGRISTLMEDRLMLRMTDPSDFLMIGMPTKEVPEKFPPGRGFRSSGLLETQVALLDKDDDGTAQVAALHRIGAAATPKSEIPIGLRPFRVDALPASIGTAAALELGPQPLRPTEVLVGVGGDDLGIRAFDAYEHGPGLLVVGPPRSGRSTTLLTMIDSVTRRGWQVLAVVPRRSPLRELTGQPGIAGVYGAEADIEQVKSVLDGLTSPFAIVVDDLELLGMDSPMAELVDARVGLLRDTGNLVIGAGTAGDLTTMYRGPAASMKKSRAGIVLSPQKYDDAEIFGINLPRGMAGGTPPGRALFVAGGRWEPVQVAAPGD